MKKKYPEKELVHLSPRLVCNTFKVIRLSNILESLIKGKEIIQVEPAIAQRIFEIAKKS